MCASDIAQMLENVQPIIV